MASFKWVPKYCLIGIDSMNLNGNWCLLADTIMEGEKL